MSLYAEAKTFTGSKRIRKNFGRLPEVVNMPNLIEVQKNSYDFFLQMHTAKDKRERYGLQAVLNELFPIEDYNGRCYLEFVSYELEKPKYEVDECVQRDLTFAAPLKVTLRLTTWDIDETTNVKTIRDIKQQEVYMGDIPLMTEKGTFIINGTERVIVSQMHRSPGVFFDHDKGKSHSSGKYLYAARVIPYRGSWLDFEFDAKDILYVRIDRRRKIPATTFLKALDSDDMIPLRERCEKEGREIEQVELRGMTKEEILQYFYKKITYTKQGNGWKLPIENVLIPNVKLEQDVVDANTGQIILEKGQTPSPRQIKKINSSGDIQAFCSHEDILGRFLWCDIINKAGLVLGEAGDEITEELLKKLEEAPQDAIEVLDIDMVNVGPYVRNTLMLDKNRTREDALIDIYRIIRPGEPPTFESTEYTFKNLFFDNDRYDLSAVGRVKLNGRLGFNDKEVPDKMRVLRKSDVLKIMHILCELKDGRGEVDDIDHLGNRRVRSVGELMENQYRMGLMRMERSIKERMSSANDIHKVVPHDLINAKPAASAVREFFGSSQLSQFMDQTNPLSEITHKRRLSALGPGGLSRERAGFEVRDVHPTHYGRICPIETPEGPNIGLINSLATFASVNKYGFIETPYRKVLNGKVTGDILFMSAGEDMRNVIAQANAAVDDKGFFTDELVACRVNGEYMMMPPSEISYIDVSPKQLVSVAAALIPFLENDDANRALMGSNMQRQAVPLLRTEAPYVGTGMESRVASDSGIVIVAKRSGIVDQVDAMRVVIRVTAEVAAGESAVDIYNLMKFQRSNQNTCINQKPLVNVGDKIKAGDIIADGPSTDLGELALGHNVMVAFMPWNGYNFEDSILISERIVHDDIFTSIHIEEFEVMSRDTKLGQEEITRDIPNAGEEALKNLDEAGIVYIGAEVEAGDVLVGKITPKGESPVTAEEKLLRAIFGAKASEMRDTSLRLPPSNAGRVVDVRVFSRRGIEKDERSLAIERSEINRLSKDRADEMKIIERSYRQRFLEIAQNHEIATAPNGLSGNVTQDLVESCTIAHLRQIVVSDDEVNNNLDALREHFLRTANVVDERFDDRVEKVRAGDDLLPGVMKMIKVFVAIKRKLQPGDKMAGRHGNKGVISRIMPLEDMPYLEDGTPVDIVLNPLGVPSRMNVGQILETHLGWACHGLGKKVNTAIRAWREDHDVEQLRSSVQSIYGDPHIASIIKDMEQSNVVELAKNLEHGVPVTTPVFDGAHEEDINKMLEQAGLDSSGQVTLIDGRTGEAFERKITVGYIYMIKLHHLVDDKIHARSVGPYSLVTQQPLGGKAQFGGQRFGEMEVWALEAYGAAYTLQEMLTVKSDDVAGRSKIYEAVVRGDDTFEAGIPESFNVLVKELRSLGLNVEMLQEKY